MKKNLTNRAINVNLVDDRIMKKLNLKYRKKNSTTDVLAFDLNEGGMLGEVYISVPQAKRQAKEYNCSLVEELVSLVQHGVLHLFGYTHKQMSRLAGTGRNACLS